MPGGHVWCVGCQQRLSWAPTAPAASLGASALNWQEAPASGITADWMRPSASVEAAFVFWQPRVWLASHNRACRTHLRAVCGAGASWGNCTARTDRTGRHAIIWLLRCLHTRLPKETFFVLVFFTQLHLVVEHWNLAALLSSVYVLSKQRWWKIY